MRGKKEGGGMEVGGWLEREVDGWVGGGWGFLPSVELELPTSPSRHRALSAGRDQFPT